MSILSDIFEIFKNIPQYILYAIESFVNLIFSGIEGLLILTVAVLPELPETVAPPEYITAINWFYPIGAIIALATPMLAAYVVFLGVRWIFNKLGEN